MENAQEQPQLCQRCKKRPATQLFDWPTETLPAHEGSVPETMTPDYLLTYQCLCDPCWESVFHPTVVETVEDLASILQQREDARRLIGGS